MSRRSEGLFAGRGISWSAILATIVVIAVGFGLGMGAGWATSLVPDAYRAATSTSPSASPTPTPTPTVDVSVAPLPPIDRELTDEDRLAGLTSTVYTYKGDGAFDVAPGEDPMPTDDVPVRLVRIDVEEGLAVDAEAFGKYVMGVLNDPRGWGSGGRMHFVQTQGVPDLRIVLASPYTTAAICPQPHAEGRGIAATADTSADPDATDAPSDSTCADRGTAPISQYDWTAGLPGYDDDITGAREYLVTHATGHVLGESEGTCVRGEALVMANQREPMDSCTVNPWAFPDAATAESDPSPSS